MVAVSESHERALKTVIRRIVPALFMHQQPWAVLGSTASSLQGLPVEPPDIDIATSIPGAYLISGCLIDYMRNPVRYGETENYASHFGIFDVEGVRVEVMGDLVIRGVGGVIDTTEHFTRWSEKVRVVKVDGIPVPCVPLEWQLVANLIIGRYDRSQAIAEFFASHPYDAAFVEDICSDERLLPPVRERVRTLLRLDETSRTPAG
jgi:hypothetical protein